MGPAITKCTPRSKGQKDNNKNGSKGRKPSIVKQKKKQRKENAK